MSIHKVRQPGDAWILEHLEIERRAVVEPWRPSVGDRVRVRLSGECPYGHDEDEDGELGTVESFITQAELDLDNPAPDGSRTVMDPGHFYYVEFDRTVGWVDRTIGFKPSSTICAAAELEIV